MSNCIIFFMQVSYKPSFSKIKIKIICVYIFLKKNKNVCVYEIINLSILKNKKLS